MAWVLDQCLILLHPFMPFVTEALWGQTGAAGDAARAMPTGRATARSWSTPRPTPRWAG